MEVTDYPNMFTNATFNTGGFQSFRAHRGPVFAMCMCGRNQVLTSGADPLVVQFELTNDGPENDVEKKKWVMTTTRSKHTHDVRALLATEECIISAGKYVFVLNIHSVILLHLLVISV